MIEGAVWIAARSGLWLEHKVAKAYLLDQHAPGELDVVFIGSSRTQQSIDTAQLRTFGISAFNYGVPGRYLGDFPYMVHRALAKRPRTIVLSVPFFSLSDPVIRRTGTYTLADAAMIFLTSDHKRGVLAELAPKVAVELLAVNRYRGLAASILEDLAARAEALQWIEGNFEIPIDLHSLSYVRGRGERFVSTHVNGDAITWAKFDGELPLGKPRPVSINPQALEMLNALADLIRASGAQAVLNLEPAEPVPCCQGVEAVRRMLRFDMVIESFAPFQTERSMRAEDWADRNHLSVTARRTYTRMLGQALRPLLPVRQAERPAPNQ